MKQCLKSYQLVLKTVGPVFVGSGKEISKKEYIFLEKQQVAVLDIPQVYGMLKKLHKDQEYEKYLLDNNRDDMGTWLKKNNISVDQIRPFIRYILDNSNSVIENKRQLQIMECIKDPYGIPYIPGSSLKGMLRTIFLSYDIIKREGVYAKEKEKITAEVFSRNKENRTTYLRENAANIENTCFHTLKRPDTKYRDAVNDYLQGMVISDSEPLRMEDLVLCQRIELHTDGQTKSLPVLRECIRPGTLIRFTITIDTSVCPIDEQKLMEAVKAFLVVYYRCFGKAFAGLDKLHINQVFLGGGCGFASKTVVYPMFDKAEGIKITKAIFSKTGVPRIHKHDLDEKYGVSPHIMKCSRYHGQLLQMGLCNLKLQERP